MTLSWGPALGDWQFMLIFHVVVLALGLGSLCAASVAAFFYLMIQKRLKQKRFGTFCQSLPSLEFLDQLALRMMSWGFVFLTVGLITGVFLAHAMWGKDWPTNPKVLFSFLTWVWVGLVLLSRYRLGWRGVRFFTFALMGFCFLLLTFVGVYFFFEKPKFLVLGMDFWR